MNHISDHKSTNAPDIECPPASALMEYLENHLSPEHAEQIEFHIDTCAHCFSAVTTLRYAGPIANETQLWNQSEKNIDERFYSHFPDAKHQPALTPRWKRILSWLNGICAFDTHMRPVFATIGAVFIIFLSYQIWLHNHTFQFSLARLDTENVLSYRAADNQNLFARALQQFEKNDYDSAYNMLSRYTREHPDDLAALYFRSLAELHRSKRSILGLQLGFYRQRILMAKKSLATTLASASDNRYIQTDCYWYLAKASIMEGNYQQAVHWFLLVINSPVASPERIHEANALIRSLRTEPEHE